MHTETNITPFAFDDHLVRTHVDEQGNPWFVAKDVCKILEIEKYRDAVARLDEDERGSVLVDTLGGEQKMTTISEAGMYALVFRSRKPQAKAFSKWVRSEVLPTLRKTGSYSIEAVETMKSYANHIRPNVRLQLLVTAQRVVNMAGPDTGAVQAVEALYYSYCKMLTEGFVPDNLQNLQSAVSHQYELVERFVQDCLEPSEHGRVTAKQVSLALANWWKVMGKGALPSSKVVGTIMRKYYEYKKSNGSMYVGVRFVETIG